MPVGIRLAAGRILGDHANVGDLLDVLNESAPDPATREAILVANPARLYGFPGPKASRS